MIYSLVPKPAVLFVYQNSYLFLFISSLIYSCEIVFAFQASLCNIVLRKHHGDITKLAHYLQWVLRHAGNAIDVCDVDFVQ